jgi:peptidoglycan/LPS O-acetylase OafA/YrhL
VLTLSGLPTGAFYAYLATYNLIYVIPLFLIVLVFSFKFSTHRLTEQEGRVLKLLSGLMMLMLGVLLVAAPEMLNQATTASLLLLIAIAATLLIVAIRSNPSSHTGRARRASHQR